MEQKYLRKTDVQWNPNISRTKNDKKYYKKHHNNECLLVIAMHYALCLQRMFKGKLGLRENWSFG